MPRLLPALLGTTLLLTSFAPAAPVPEGARGPVLYFPVTAGARWVYQDGPDEWVEQVTAVERQSGGMVVTVGVIEDGGVVPRAKVFVTADGLYVGPGGADAKTFPRPLLKLPARPGDRLDWGEAASEFKAVRTVRGVEDVVVPAGAYRAVRVEAEYLLDGEAVMTTVSWYAPRVGCVRQVKRLGERDYTRELRSFTSAEQRK